MSDLAVGTARIIVRPDTTLFRRQLLEEVNRSISQAQSAVRPIQIPIISSLGGSVIAQTAALTAAQQSATQSTLGLASAAQVENTAFGRQAVILQGVTTATLEKAGADAAAATAARVHASAQADVQRGAIASLAGLTGLRGAVLAASTGFLAAAVGVQALIAAVQQAAALEQTLNVFAVTTRATADQMERVSEAAQALGRDITLPGVAAQDAAVAMTTLAKAGLSVEQSMDAARGALQLATAAQIDNAAAAELVANSVNTFRLSGTEATRVADLLTGASLEAQGSIEDMGIALRQSASAASAIGLTINDTVTLITALAKAGLQGSDAGTTLRVALLNLAAPTKEAREELDRLNISVRDTATGAIRPDVFLQVEAALQGVSQAQADATRRIIFGQNAFRVSSLLGRQTAESMEELYESVTQAGLATEVAGAQTEGFSGDLENLKNQASALGTSVGQLVIPPLGLMIRLFADAVGAAATLAGGFVDLIERSREVGAALGDIVPFADEAGGVLDGFAGKVLKVTTRAQFLGPGLTVASLAMDRFAGSTDNADREVTELTESLASFDREMRRVAIAAQNLGPTDVQGQGLNVQQILNRIQGFDSQQTRAQIRNDNEALISSLQAEQAFLEDQLQRAFVQRRPGLVRQLEAALLGVTNELESISNQAASEKRQAASRIAAEQADADRAFIDALSQRRDVFEATRGAAVAATESVQDDIRFQNNLQALIKKQIDKILDTVEDEKLRAQAINQLRLALIASQNAEKALRQQRAEDRAAARQESVNLDIEFAEITGNTAREIAARQRLIALLKKQQAAVKKGTAEWKRLRNEIAEQQQAIKDAQGQAQEGNQEGNRAAEFFFEQLQAQQGFASNLLGNLITGPTQGLVGVPSPTTPAAQVSLAANLQEGKIGSGPTAGQANATNDLLLRILQQLKILTGGTATPEADQNRRAGAAVMDGVGGGSGSASVM